MWFNRLKEIRQKHQLTQQKIADILGKDVTRISRYERGDGAKNMPSFMKHGLLNIFSPEEVIYIEYGEDAKNILMVQSGSGNIQQNQGRVSHVGESKQPYNDEDTISVPYYPEVYASAGGGAMVYDSLTGTEPMQLSRAFVENFLGVSFNKNIHILNVKGDSMSPTIVDGELIFVSPLNGNGIVDGQIYVIMYEDEIYVKRIRKVPFSKRFNLSSDNPDVSDIELTEDQTAACTVIGEVVGQMRRKGQR